MNPHCYASIMYAHLLTEIFIPIISCVHMYMSKIKRTMSLKKQFPI